MPSIGDLVEFVDGHAWIALSRKEVAYVGLYLGEEPSPWGTDHVVHVILIGQTLRRFPVRPGQEVIRMLQETRGVRMEYSEKSSGGNQRKNVRNCP